MRRLALTVVCLLMSLASALAETGWPNQREGDFIVKDFRFASGEVLPELKLHYTTLGTPKHNAAGEIVNAVLLLHGTSSTGKMWLEPSLANELFAPGQPLDASRYYIVLPDGIGRGGSSKPSDGLRAKFPHYRYHDMIETQRLLLTEGLGVKHLRLVAGASMGGMHTWMWGGLHPDFMDALMPIASQPVAISGRNWLYRRIAIEAIRNDPEWNNGEYEKNPSHYVRTAPFAFLMTESVVQLQEMAPSREAGDMLYQKLVERARLGDANNQLYATEAVMDYDPAPTLPKIKARLIAVNFADDEVNAPELGVVERAIEHIPNARYVLVPAGADSHGHFTYMRAALWKAHLAELMQPLP
jgi:homoserine O-acetyltransferase